MPDAERLAEIRARVEAATPGPWEGARGSVHLTFDKEGSIFPPDTTGQLGFQAGGPVAVVQDNGEFNDLDFLVAARADVPDLLAEVDRLRAALRDIAFYLPVVSQANPPPPDAEGIFELKAKAAAALNPPAGAGEV